MPLLQAASAPAAAAPGGRLPRGRGSRSAPVVALSWRRFNSPLFAPSQLFQRDPKLLQDPDDATGSVLYHHLLQKSLVDWIGSLYRGSWQTELLSFEVPTGRQLRFQPSGATPEPSKILTTAEITTLLNGNKFAGINTGMPPQIALPPRAKLRITRRPGRRSPVLCIIDGSAGLRPTVGEIWSRATVQRCCVHKLRNLERKAPTHALAEIRDDTHRIVYAENADAARAAYTAFERPWAKRCPGLVTSLREGGDELLTFFSFPKTQWNALRTSNTIERLHEECRRRVKTQGSLPGEDAALILLFSLVASGQIRLRRIDGWRKIATALRQHTPLAA